MSHAAHPPHAEHAADDHHLAPRTYYVVFGVLMVLLILTWAAARVDLGPLNIPIALAIAAAKTAVIMIYFMHLKFMTPLVRLFAVAGFVWLGIGALLTAPDYLARGWFSGRTAGEGTNYMAPAIDRVFPGAEPGAFSITPPGQTAEDPADTDSQ